MGDNHMKPCPFCGGQAVFRASLHQSVIECAMGNACAVTPAVSRKSFSEAQRAWNFRFNDKEK